jgi:hypothetical protein
VPDPQKAQSILHGLDALAVLLGVVLVVVIIGAIVYYRRAKNARLTP